MGGSAYIRYMANYFRLRAQVGGPGSIEFGRFAEDCEYVAQLIERGKSKEPNWAEEPLAQQRRTR